MMTYTKTVRINNEVLYVSIPVDVANSENIKEGDFVTISIEKVKQTEIKSE